MKDMNFANKTRGRRLSRLAGVAALAITSSLLNASGLASQPTEADVQEIVDRAIARAEAQEHVVAQFESMMLSVVESLDGKGSVKKEEKAVYRRHPILGAVYDEMVEKDGRPLTEKELAKEKKQKDKFVREVEKRTARGEPPQPEDNERISLDQEFFSRYRLELIGEETVRGHTCWVVYIEPREGKLPVRRRIDHALNNSTGKLWITQHDYGLARVEFEMQKPFRYWGGLVAMIRNTVGKLNFERVEPDLWMPADFIIELDLRIFFKNIRRRITMSWSDYKRVTAPIPATSSSSSQQQTP
jgi:hypothetical protein